jgi:hypothetical protein
MLQNQFLNLLHLLFLLVNFLLTKLSLVPKKYIVLSGTKHILTFIMHPTV